MQTQPAADIGRSVSARKPGLDGLGLAGLASCRLVVFYNDSLPGFRSVIDATESSGRVFNAVAALKRPALG
jgi:hypothetical protein